MCQPVDSGAKKMFGEWKGTEHFRCFLFEMSASPTDEDNSLVRSEVSEPGSQETSWTGNISLKVISNEMSEITQIQKMAEG